MTTEEFTLEFKTQQEWGWLAVLDFFLAGGGAGLFLLGVFLDIKAAAAIGIIATGLGALALLADLGRPERFWRALAKPGTSWISRGALLVGIFLLFGIIHTALWYGGSPDTGLSAVARAIAAVAAVGVMAYTGFLMSFSPAIPAWHSTLLPVMFIVSSLITATGAIFLMTLALDVGTADLRTWEQLGLVLVVVALILVLAYIATTLSSTLAARQAISTLLRGNLASTFLGGAILVGMILPLALLTTTYLADIGQPTVKTYLAIAGILLLAGGVALRYSLLRAGVYQPMV